MKTKTVNVYSYLELSKEAKLRVLHDLRVQAETDLDFYSDEILKSMLAIAAECGLTVKDYSFGVYDQNWKFVVDGDNADLSGDSASAWFGNILGDKGYKAYGTEFKGSCGFTGVCWDDDLAESVWKSLLSGKSVKRAFDCMAYAACKLLENALNYRQSEECILGMLDMDEEIYLENGELA